MELLQNFIPVLIICKFEEDPIKTEGAMASTTFFQRSVADNSLFYGCAGYLQVWWRSDKKWGRYCVHNIFSILVHEKHFRRTKASNSKANSQIWPKTELVQDLMPCFIMQVWRRSDQNWRHYRVHNIFSSTQGQVILKSMDGCGWNSTLSEILWLSWLSASLMMTR